MFKIGDKLTKENYTQGAIWCNKNNATINPVTWVIEAIPEPTVEELQAKVREVRNNYLVQYVDPKQLVMVWNGLSEEERQLYADYRQYLLDYTELEDWYLSNPMTLEEWKNSAKPVEEFETSYLYPAEPESLEPEIAVSTEPDINAILSK